MVITPDLGMVTKSLASTISLLPLLFIISTGAQSENNESNYYDLCAPFDCGNITFSFPFSPADTFGSGAFDCGLPRFQIACDPTTSLPGLELSGRLYQVKDLYLSENLITVVDHQLINDLRSDSCGSLRNLSFSTTANDSVASLNVPPWDTNFNFFECPNELNLNRSGRVVGNYTCKEGYWVHLWDDESWNETRLRPPRDGQVETPSGCELVTLPVFRASLSRYGFLNLTAGGDESSERRMELLPDVLSDGFPLQWPTVEECVSCQQRGERCGYDGSLRRIVCLCKGGCDLATYKKGISTIFKTCYFIKNSATEDERNAKQFIKDYQSMLLTNYSYNDIKKMTKGFKEKLGAGGYGNVYKGELSDGRLIAVKILENYKDNSNNFIAEVATIGMIHHVNVIRLLGFCWDGSKQALIYEFMPNGSLGDLLSKDEVNPLLTRLEKLLEIGIGVAYGLEYLHNGCESRILHLDIKPHNVLLDQNFNPKISDFGLAKMYSRNQSVVSMTGARGTIGYIAPEVFMRNLGKPSHKSDVYSFGMLLLEMVGGKNHVKPERSNSSEAYFPGWLYDKLIEEENMEPAEFVVEEEVLVARKMVIVGLWCIQINPKERPSMTRVIEMLCGNVEAIEMPPKPFFFSPPRVQFEHENTSNESDTSVLRLTCDSHDQV